jgi:hypothetical protein
MNRFVIVVCAFALVTRCSTSYQSSGATGGYAETKLSDRSYQIRFEGNGYTSNSRVSVFILRRAAELTLEQGFRYFVFGGQQTQTSHSMDFNFANQSAVVRFLDSAGEDSSAVDAVTVIESTNKDAAGRLSRGALEALKRLNTSR